MTKNAIIIAAGMGTRLRPITTKIPKPLIKIYNKPMIEYSIEKLLDIGINEIIIVCGYLNEQFNYLEKKYRQVKLIKNERYKDYNNIYSFYMIKDYLKDTYFLEGDILIKGNFLEKLPNETTYFSKKIKNKNNEWQLIADEGNKVSRIEIGGENNYIISGVSFFKRKDTEILKRILEETKLEERKNIFWDDLVRENIEKFNIKITSLNEDEIYEIDTLEELKKIDKTYNLMEG